MNDKNSVDSNGKKDQPSVLELGKISEIARNALKDLISASKPAIPPYYEKAFYSKATEMGETELINYISSTLPTGQKATLMVEGVSTVISNLNSEIQQYRSGIDNHGELIEEKHDIIQQIVPPDVWNILEKHLSGLQNANKLMRIQLENLENQLQNQTKAVSKLQRETRKDPLTGAMNRLALEEHLPKELARNKRYNRTFSVVMVDIDHFKNINDTHGHATGNEVLKAFAHLLQKTLREVDIIYRYEGAKFFLLLPETDAAGAPLAAERLRKVVDSKMFTHRDDPSIKLRLTSSFGVSAISKNDSSYLDIIERADKALYNAKKNGRNQVDSLFTDN